LQFRTRLNGLYTEVFSGSESQGLGNAGITSFAKKWGWFGYIYGLCKGNILKSDEVAKLNIHKTLLWQSYELDLQEIQSQEIKKNASR
jgi:hypothetical protein